VPQDDAGPPKELKERTGVHKCVGCLRETPSEEYFANDYVCDGCAGGEEGEIVSDESELRGSSEP